MTPVANWQALKGKVAKAFAALKKRGIDARGPVGFDQAEALHQVAKAGRYRSYAFYHSQDSRRARGGGSLWIGFGCAMADAKPAESVLVGREVAEAMKEGGLFVDWNGSAKTRIAVHLSAKAAASAIAGEEAGATKRALATRKLSTDRIDPEAFFAKLRPVFEGLEREGTVRLFFGRDVASEERAKAATRSQRTVLVCPSAFSPTWDRLNVYVATYPQPHDKAVVKGIAEVLRRAGFKVALVHDSYLHLRTTT
jgi:hypothetical protein